MERSTHKGGLASASPKPSGAHLTLTSWNGFTGPNWPPPVLHGHPKQLEDAARADGGRELHIDRA